MNRITLSIAFISVFTFLSLISVNQVFLAENAFAEEDQAGQVLVPVPPIQPTQEWPDFHQNDVVSIGQGRIIGEDEIVKDVVVIGGNLIVNGTVNGDAVCIGGNLTVGPGATIKGDTVNIGGQLIVDPLAVTHGERVNVRGAFPLGSLKGIGTFFKILPLVIDSVCFIFILFIALIMFAFMPRQFDHIEEYLTNEFPRCALLGIACMIGLPIATVFLFISMVGILAVPFLMMAIIVSCMMGVVVFGRVLGRKLLTNSPFILQILIGLLLLYGLLLAGDIIILLSSVSVYSIIGHVLRWIGIIILICVNFIGLGSVVYSVWGTRGISRGQGDKPNNFSSMSGGANTAAA